MATNPMHQFEVYRIGPEIVLGSVNFSFTNSSLFMVMSAITILFLLLPILWNSFLPNFF